MTGRIKTGMKLRSNDPRDNGKTVEVIRVDYTYDNRAASYSNYAVYQTQSRVSKVRTDRIHEPGYQGKTGWTIVEEPKTAPSVDLRPGAINYV